MSIFSSPGLGRLLAGPPAASLASPAVAVRPCVRAVSDGADRRASALWPTVWLAITLVGCKAAHLGLPTATWAAWEDYQQSLAIAAHQDLLFAIAFGLIAHLALWAARPSRFASRIAHATVIVVATLLACYGVGSVFVYNFVGSPLTYPLLKVAGGVKDMSSSVGHFATPLRVSAVAGVPVAFVLLAWWSPRFFNYRPRTRTTRWMTRSAVAVVLTAYVLFAHQASARRDWLDRPDHRVSLNPHWVFMSSLLTSLTDDKAVDLGDFPPAFAADFATAGQRAAAEATQPAASALDALLPPGTKRPRNVITVVIESCPTQHMSLYGSKYKTTPRLDAEARHALVFDNFYAHQGLTANSLGAITLATYPPPAGWPVTSERSDLPGTMLQQVLSPLGYRTAFISSGDNDYLSQDKFLDHRGFDDVWDARSLEQLLGCKKIFSWGVEDRCMVDAMFKWIDADAQRGKPFYLLSWTQQTHHPYEMTPGTKEINFVKNDKVPDAWDYNHYLNCLYTADRQIGRLMDGLRKRGLADDTLIVITGDHGEAFGTPHDVWGHGSAVYEENLRVPLMIWSPRLFPTGHGLPQIGGHVDLNATIVDLLGLGSQVKTPETWQGFSLFASDRPNRQYGASVNGDYLLCVRQDNWKYTYNATLGRATLFDLSAGPTEQRDVSTDHPDLCATLRQRLAARVACGNERYRELARR